jgi:small GTP-binding protein
MSDLHGQKGCKVVLLGDSGVGKTCIISRYISGTFDSNSASTNGASYASKNITYEKLGGKSLLLDIWDTAGQEKYKALTKFFYKDAAVAILVYDITLRQSFDNIKDYWYEQIKENGDKNIVLGIAGNKCDLYEEEAVPEAEAREFAASVGAIFSLTSAQNNTGINELFADAGNKYLDPNFQQKVQGEKEEKEEGRQKITIEKSDEKKERKKKSFC